MRRFEQLIEILESKGIQFVSGLTDQEINNIQGSFNIIFPPDLKVFLQLGLPIADGFVNWRYSLESDDYKQKITSLIEWPLDGILFDVNNNAFWMESWGHKPKSHNERQEIVKKNYIKYPKLIPIYSHRYISSDPLELDNPVLSVYQTDVIYYGFNIFDYFAKEFHFDLPENFNVPSAPVREIPFWSELVVY
jgi:hypothetical protein